MIGELQAANAALQAECSQLRSQLAEQQAETHQLRAECAELQGVADEQLENIAELQRSVALLERSLFGRRRERFDNPDQLLLFQAVELEQAQPPADGKQPAPGEKPEPKPRAKRGRRRRVFPDSLPRRRIEHPLDPAQIPPGQENGRRFFKLVLTQVESTPAQLYVAEHYVECIATDNDDATASRVVTASRPPRLLKSFAAPSLLADLAVWRFADHLPYYRLEETLLRSGLEIDRATQCRWLINLAEGISPLVQRMRWWALRSKVLQADETSVRQLQPGLGPSRTSYLWAVLGDAGHPYTTFHFTEDRSRAGPDQFFAGFTGQLVVDAYVCYELMGAESLGRIELCGCLVHARRKFEALHKLGETEDTRTALQYFSELFDLEDQLRDLDDASRLAARQLHARPLMDRFKSWLDGRLPSLRPKHPLRLAILYMTKRWEVFTRFLESGAVPVHNNASEQAVKSPVIGKKNWMFFGSSAGGEAAAVWFTLTTTCRRLWIDPSQYLRAVIETLPRLDPASPEQLDELLPDRWLASRPEARLDFRLIESRQAAARRKLRRAARRRPVTADQ